MTNKIKNAVLAAALLVAILLTATDARAGGCITNQYVIAGTNSNIAGPWSLNADTNVFGQLLVGSGLDNQATWTFTGTCSCGDQTIATLYWDCVDGSHDHFDFIIPAMDSGATYKVYLCGDVSCCCIACYLFGVAECSQAFKDGCNQQ